MAGLILAHHWQTSPLGPPHRWPSSLKTVTGMMLLSSVPIVLLWGEDGIMIYNDAYSAFAGARHPGLLGSAVREGWNEVSEFNDHVMTVCLGGGTLAFKNQELTLHRHGRPEQVWMNLDYSPVLDEHGTPAGVIAIVVETTDKVLADRRLHESERRLRAFTSAASDVIYRMSPDWKELWAIEGRDVPSAWPLPNATWLETYVPPEDRQSLAKTIADSVRGKKILQLEHRVLRSDGSIRWASTRAVPILDDDGNIVDWFGASSDITARRTADARREMLLRVTAAIESHDDPEALAGQICRLLGETLQVSRVGYGIVDPIANALTLSHDWAAPGVKRLAPSISLHSVGLFMDDIRRGASVAVADASTDPRLAAYGTGFAEYASRAFVDVPVMEGQEAVALFFVSDAAPRAWLPEDLDLIKETAARMRTAIERKRAERALQELAASLEAQVAERTRERDRVWRNSQDLSVILDESGAFVAVNPAITRVLGWSEADMLGRSIFDFIVAEDAALTRAAQTAGAPETPRSVVNRYRCRDGGLRWISWTAITEQDRTYASGRDITAEKEAADALAASEAALRQAQKMEAVGQLTGGLAHDFNNILAGIGGSLELIQTRLVQGRFDELDRFITAAQGATKRAAALTHRLLAFSRRATLDPRPLDINRLVAGMQDLIARSVGPSITVQVVLAAELWATLADAGQLENALLNLSLNARDAMPDGGRLMIETANTWLDDRAGRPLDLPPGQYVALGVSDTGTGMTPDIVERAFDPFFTTKPLGQGTGLGLSMIYGFARQSGGSARIYSELGQGSCVRIYLPRHHGPDIAAVDDEVAPVRIPRATKGQTILVVDDEPLVRLFVTEVLQELGYAVLEGEDGPSGLRVLSAAARIDLLITDVGLPNGMNGRQLADSARRARPGLNVLFITGYAENAALNHGHLAPGMQVITKPFGMETLAMRVRELVGSD